MKKKSKWITGIVIVALIVAAIIVYKTKFAKVKSEFEFQTVTVKRDSLINTVTATGTLQPILTVQIGTQVSGVIAKRYVDFNSKVKKGQILAELDKRPLIAAQKNARANFATQKANYELQQKNYNRQKELWDKQSISASAWDQAETSYKTAKESLDQARASLDVAELNLGYATIKSSIDGVVTSRSIEEGQTVAASFNTPTLFTIANDLTKMWVIANVDETDIGSVKEGQKVTFSVYSFPDDIFYGTVLQVRLNGINTNNVITYEVVIDAPNKELKLLPGQTANANIITLDEKNILTIPMKALRFTPDPNLMNQMKINISGEMPNNEKLPKDRHIVWQQVNGNTIKPILITTGANNGSSIEVIEGLTENSEVILSVQSNAQAKTAQPGGSSPFVPKFRSGAGSGAKK